MTSNSCWWHLVLWRSAKHALVAWAVHNVVLFLGSENCNMMSTNKSVKIHQFRLATFYQCRLCSCWYLQVLKATNVCAVNLPAWFKQKKFLSTWLAFDWSLEFKWMSYLRLRNVLCGQNRSPTWRSRLVKWHREVEIPGERTSISCLGSKVT